MLWDDFGNKVLTATWRRLSFHSHFLLTTLTGITTQTEEEEEQQAGGGEGLGYEAASGKAAQEGPAQTKTRLSTRLLEKVWFCSPRLPRFSTSLFSFPFQGEKGSIPPRGGGVSWPAAASATAQSLQSENLLRKTKKRDHPVLKTSPTRASRKVLA